MSQSEFWSLLINSAPSQLTVKHLLRFLSSKCSSVETDISFWFRSIVTRWSVKAAWGILANSHLTTKLNRCGKILGVNTLGVPKNGMLSSNKLNQVLFRNYAGEGAGRLFIQELIRE